MALDKNTNRYIFQKVTKPFEKINITPKNAKEARDWYRNIALSINQVRPKALLNNAPEAHQHTIFSPGNMYMFQYSAKNKDDPKKLPFWDAYPLIFPIELYGDHILSINLHYLPPYHRAKLMDALYTTSNSYNNKKKYDDKTVLNINYQLLKSTAKFAAFKPCIKAHLLSHIQSNFVYIKPTDWDQVLLLPTQRFQRKSATYVWEDSLKKIYG